MKSVSYAARDGATVYGYLTLPKSGSAPNPLLMVVHGGPAVRDVWGFNPEVQFLAKLGYAVLQVNYRGSTGYGISYARKNILEVCRFGISDVADGARWAVRNGYADPDRIAIYGGSFGGYAALAGAAFESDLYRCAIGYAGVYDWVQQMKEDKKDFREYVKWRNKYYPDLDDHRKEYESISPRFAAQNVNCPVLLIHGGSDLRVQSRQAKLMQRALKAAGKECEMIINNWGIHGLPKESKRIEFYVSVARFLQRHM